MADGEENCFQDGAEYDSYGNRIRHKKVRLNYDTGYNNQVSGHQVRVIRKIDSKKLQIISRGVRTLEHFHKVHFPSPLCC